MTWPGRGRLTLLGVVSAAVSVLLGVPIVGASYSSTTDGAWHHVVATVSPGSGIRLYLDGSLAATTAYTAPNNITDYWRLGGDTWDGAWPTDYFWRGELDEVAIYSTELSAERVAVHHHANH